MVLNGRSRVEWATTTSRAKRRPCRRGSFFTSELIPVSRLRTRKSWILTVGRSVCTPTPEILPEKFRSFSITSRRMMRGSPTQSSHMCRAYPECGIEDDAFRRRPAAIGVLRRAPPHHSPAGYEDKSAKLFADEKNYSSRM